jgi:dihydroxy-acid dehydratase
VVGHITPEAQVGGNIALIHNGDKIIIDAEKNTIDVLVSDEVLDERKKSWVPKELPKRGILAKYARTVASASEGCVTDKF